MTRQHTIQDKQKRLATIIDKFESLCVAFSGGVDSTFLLAIAKQVLGDHLLAVTAVSPIHAKSDTAQAIRLARQLNVRHQQLPSQEMDSENFRANPKERCYHCKKQLFKAIQELAQAHGIHHVAHGANVDDLSDYRPGFKATQELGIVAPLLDAGLTKADIRALSQEMGLETWNQPAKACLASRIPHGTPITRNALQMVEQTETMLTDLGFVSCRVRHHGRIARIEIPPEEIHRMVKPRIRLQVLDHCKKIGFTYVALDLEGYVQGSLNRMIET